MKIGASIQVERVTSRRDFRTFLTFPWRIYQGDSNWVPPLLIDLKNQLNPRKNPFFQEGRVAYWMASVNGKNVGRIAAIIYDPHNRYHGGATGFFAFFEVINNLQVADALLKEATQWLRVQGMDRMLGPINLETTHECGTLIEGFNRPPVLQMAYNPAYYRNLLEGCGLEKEIDLLAFYVTEKIVRDTSLLDRLERISLRNLKNNRVTIRTFKQREFASEVQLVRKLYNDFMQDNWGFVPASQAEFDFMAETLKLLLVPELVLFAEVDGKVVGLSLALPDLNQVLIKMNGRIFPTGWIKFLRGRKKIKDIRVMLMGVKETYRNRGIETHFYLHTIKEGYKIGYTGAELSWVMESNDNLITTLGKLNANPYKRYRVFKRDF